MKKDVLLWAALLAALAVTASAEYDLARAAGFGQYVAGGVPAALDVYAVRALKARRDVAAVVLAMIAVNGMSHLVATGLLPVSVPLVVSVSSIAPLVLWRVHRLAEHVGQAPEPVVVPAEPNPVPAPLEWAPEPKPQASSAEPAPPAWPQLGPMIPVAELLAGTSRDHGDTGSFAGTNPYPAPAGPEPEIPEPEAEPQAGSDDPDPVPPGVAVEHVEAAREWLATNPELTGTAIGTKLGKSDSYGRRVRRAAMGATS